MNKPILTALMTAALGLASAGCALFSSDNTHPVIRESALNWLEIDYLPGRGKPPSRLSLQGMGNVRLKRGTSPLVKDDFAYDIANVHWNDIQSDQINVDPAEMRNLFQALVDRGVLDKPNPDFLATANNGGPIAHFHGSLNGDLFDRAASEPELTEFVFNLLQLFDTNKRDGAHEQVVRPQ